jgi:hypothetical protein
VAWRAGDLRRVLVGGARGLKAARHSSASVAAWGHPSPPQVGCFRPEAAVPEQGQTESCYASPMIRWRRRNYLVSFHPLCSTPHGRRAVKAFSLPAFIDGSCRREPDFQSAWPSITALCRAGKFAPRLRVGDRVFYMTVKARYMRITGRGLVAALEVIRVLPTHQAAARWYRERGLNVPSNCMVRGNLPIPVPRTRGLPRSTDESWKLWSKSRSGLPSLAAWDRGYVERARDFPCFVITQPIKGPVVANPRIVRDEQINASLGTDKVPGTQSYKLLSDSSFAALLKLM